MRSPFPIPLIFICYETRSLPIGKRRTIFPRTRLGAAARCYVLFSLQLFYKCGREELHCQVRSVSVTTLAGMHCTEMFVRHSLAAA